MGRALWRELLTGFSRLQLFQPFWELRIIGGRAQSWISDCPCYKSPYGTYSGLECPSAHLMALRSTLIWSTTPLSNIFSSFCTKSKLRSSITPDTYVVPAHNEKGLSLLTLLYEFYFLPEINCSASGCTKNWTKAFFRPSMSASPPPLFTEACRSDQNQDPAGSCYMQRAHLPN